MTALFASSVDTLVPAAAGAGVSATTGRFALDLRAVAKNFHTEQGSVAAVRSIDLQVPAGQFLAVVGASGCGKTTLLSMIAGLEQPTSGTVEVSGRIALMFQDATLLPWLTAGQNIELALRIRGVARRARRARAGELLSLVQLGHAYDRRPHELSGGMRQRVALARCLAQDASIVLMDEPLGALDAMTRDHLHEVIERISTSQKLTVLLVTHNMREAVRLADRVVLLSGGRVAATQQIDLPRPRIMDSPEVAVRAADLTARLRAAEGGELGGR
ncbi:MAG: ABC transporter ATP-binding protein [Candidatus Nanopelagicales bacterium]